VNLPRTCACCWTPAGAAEVYLDLDYLENARRWRADRPGGMNLFRQTLESPNLLDGQSIYQNRIRHRAHMILPVTTPDQVFRGHGSWRPWPGAVMREKAPYQVYASTSIRAATPSPANGRRSARLHHASPCGNDSGRYEDAGKL